MRIFMPAAMAAAVLLGAAAAVPNAAVATGGPAMVEIKDFAFKPAVLNVTAGDTVKFVNHDQEAHTVVAQSGAFTSSGLDTNDEWTVRIAKPGKYPYFCSLHPYMKGTIVVRAARGMH
jgi:plastocyanin